MLLAIEKEQGKEFLDRYYAVLGATGYVKQPMVVRYLVWLFLVDFAELVYQCLTDDDYNLINDALIYLFSTGCCLLPYKYTRAPIVFEEDAYIGNFNLRATEYAALRASMDERLRGVEEL